MKALRLLIIFCLISAKAFSLELVELPSDTAKSSCSFKANYATNSIYFGRSDSIVTPLYGFDLTYTNPKGIYLEGIANILPNRTVSKFDMAAICAGYNYSLFKDNVSGTIGYSRYFYSKYSTQVGSVIRGTASMSFYTDLKLFQLSSGFYLNHGDKVDIKINPSVSKAFYVKKVFRDSLKVVPTITLFAGTQNLMGTYILTRSGKIKNIHNKKNSSVGGNTQTISQTYSQFNILSLDLSLPLSFTYKRFIFNLTPSYSIPFNVHSDEFTNHHFLVDFSVVVNIR